VCDQLAFGLGVIEKMKYAGYFFDRRRFFNGPRRKAYQSDQTAARASR
jgi:hypothetical protein